ncbi:MAG: hypothetical protein ACRETY_11970 [Steroidobacteraceae bacterium]
MPVAIVATQADYRLPMESLLPGAHLPAVDGEQTAFCKAKRSGGGWVFVLLASPGQARLELPEEVPDCRVEPTPPASTIRNRGR